MSDRGTARILVVEDEALIAMDLQALLEEAGYEVLGGLRPGERDRLIRLLREITGREGISVVLIEHVMGAVMALAQTVIVLHHGEVIAQGTPSDVVRHPAVLDCYLGAEIGDKNAGNL